MLLTLKSVTGLKRGWRFITRNEIPTRRCLERRLHVIALQESQITRRLSVHSTDSWSPHVADLQVSPWKHHEDRRNYETGLLMDSECSCVMFHVLPRNPVLYSLYWLPVASCIRLKVLQHSQFALQEAWLLTTIPQDGGEKTVSHAQTSTQRCFQWELGFSPSDHQSLSPPGPVHQSGNVLLRYTRTIKAHGCGVRTFRTSWLAVYIG